MVMLTGIVRQLVSGAPRWFHSPGPYNNYNKYMNAVDRSDQILATNNVNRKCMRWWKTLFFHLIDIAMVNSFLLFREHQSKFPDNVDLHRPSHFSLGGFREEIVRQLCNLPEYDVHCTTSSFISENSCPYSTFHCPPKVLCGLSQAEQGGLQSQFLLQCSSVRRKVHAHDN